MQTIQKSPIPNELQQREDYDQCLESGSEAKRAQIWSLSLGECYSKSQQCNQLRIIKNSRPTKTSIKTQTSFREYISTLKNTVLEQSRNVRQHLEKAVFVFVV